MAVTYSARIDGEFQDVTGFMVDTYLPSARTLYVGERDAEELAEQHAMCTLSEDLGQEVRKVVDGRML